MCGASSHPSVHDFTPVTAVLAALGEPIRCWYANPPWSLQDQVVAKTRHDCGTIFLVCWTDAPRFRQLQPLITRTISARTWAQPLDDLPRPRLDKHKWVKSSVLFALVPHPAGHRIHRIEQVDHILPTRWTASHLFGRQTGPKGHFRPHFTTVGRCSALFQTSLICFFFAAFTPFSRFGVWVRRPLTHAQLMHHGKVN